MKSKSFLFIVTLFLFSFANAQSQMITGTLVPDKKKAVVFLPGNKKDTVPSAQNGSTAVTKPVAAENKIKTPLDVLDTTLINANGGDMISKYSLPPQKSSLRPQLITGTLIAKEGAAIAVVPVSEDSLMKQNMPPPIVQDNPLFPPERGETIKDSSIATTTSPTTTVTGAKSVLDGLDTTNMVYDPSTHISSSTLALRPSEYKHQMLPAGLLIPQKGEPVIIEPISKDSLEALNRKLADTTTMQSSDANSSNDSYNNTSFPDSSAASSFKTNFYVHQNGKFSIRFTSEKFYLNISEEGKVIDFEILSNGKITSNANSKIVQVGNLKVKYNDDGSITSIADTRVAYTFDGKVNRVGNISISYNKEGLAEKVADMLIIYNSIKSVEKIADFRVGYDAKLMVIGIDDSNGLVVFKPEMK